MNRKREGKGSGISRREFCGKAAKAAAGLAATGVGCPLIWVSRAWGKEKRNVVFGLNVPLTGPYSLQGKDQLNAFKVAIDELNRMKGGVLGRKVRYVVRNTGSNPKRAAKNARNLIRREKAVMVTGGSSSAVAIAVSKVCQEEKRVFMATVTHSDETTGKYCHRHTFRKYNNAWMSSKAAGEVLLEKFGKNVRYFHITADYTWGWSCEKTLRMVVEKAGCITVGSVATPLGTKNFLKPLREAERAKPDVLVLNHFGRDMVKSLTQATQLGFKKKMKIFIPLMEIHMALKAGPYNMYNVLTTMPWYWGLKDRFPAAKVFVDKFLDLYGTPPGNGAEAAYTNIMEYADAVERAGTFDSRSVIRKLEGHRFRSLKDTEYWRSWDHQCIQTTFVAKGKHPVKMRNKWDFFKIIGERSGDAVARKRDESPCRLEPL